MNEHWTTAVSVLASGGVLATVAALVLGRRGAREPENDARLEFSAARDAALARLRDADSGAVFATPAERRELELEAARAVRDLARAGAARREPAPDAPSPRRDVLTHRWAWGLGSAGVGVAIVLSLQAFTTPRAPGASMTGGTGIPMAARPAVAPDPSAAEFEARALREPGNLDAQLDLADAYLRAPSTLFQAFQVSKAVLEKSPENPRALVQQAIVRAAMGQHDKARELAAKAVARDPSLVVGWVTRSREASLIGQADEARDALEKAIALDPSRKEELEAEADGAPPAPATPAPVAASGDITGTLTLDPALAAALPDGAFVFVLLRDPAAGPMPIAARRLPAKGFPISFSLGAADVLPGRTMPAKGTLEARVDADGNASTRDPGDPAARLEQIAPGTANLQLDLRVPATATPAGGR